MKLGAVINPASGTLRAQGEPGRRELATMLAVLADPAHIRFVDGADAAQQARQLVEEGVDVLVAGGGDGTISAVAAVAVKAGVPLGVLPLGTLNHFARDIAVPASLPAAIEVLQRKRVRRVDLGEVNGRIFLNNVSLGMYPALVAQRERYQRMHGWKKLPAHLVAAWQVFRRFPSSRLTVEVNGRRISRRTPVLLIGNNAYDGGLLADAKRQAMDAGKLWVCMAPSEGVLALLRTGWAFVTGHLQELPELDSELASSLRVEARRRSIRVAIDGEALRMRVPLELKSLPRALEAIVP